jgi:hypothetical protein
MKRKSCGFFFFRGGEEEEGICGTTGPKDPDPKDPEDPVWGTRKIGIARGAPAMP